MLYLDSSIIVAYCLNESTTPWIRDTLKMHRNDGMVSTLFSFLEIESAFQRRFNSKEISSQELDKVRLLALRFKQNMALLPLDSAVMEIAMHVQKLHQIRPGDSVQLASAIYCQPKREHVIFLTSDQKLAHAAKLEGLTVV